MSELWAWCPNLGHNFYKTSVRMSRCCLYEHWFTSCRLWKKSSFSNRAVLCNWSRKKNSLLSGRAGLKKRTFFVASLKDPVCMHPWVYIRVLLLVLTLFISLNWGGGGWNFEQSKYFGRTLFLVRPNHVMGVFTKKINKKNFFHFCFVLFSTNFRRFFEILFV